MPMLMEMDGEPVTYNRVVNGSAASGFPKSIEVLFRIEGVNRRTMESGRGDASMGVATIELADIGSLVQIGNDRITRADSTVWTVEEVIEVVGGVVTARMKRFGQVSVSSRDARLER